jgi:RNA polymerase sigma-70 factor (ECF subfamily)
VDDKSGDLVARWRAGDERAAAELFRRYAGRLIVLARSRLPAKLARRVDAEDVVQSVYRSFFADARNGRFDLQRGGDLWRLLVAITMHKLRYQVRQNRAGKRDVQRERAFGSEESLLGIPTARLARDPSPAEAVALADALEQLMAGLRPLDRRIFELRLQGYAIEEIAADTKRSERRVYSILEQIKQSLQQSHTGTPLPD